MAKKLKNFRLSDEAIKILSVLAKKDDRAEAYIVEKLLLEKGEKEKLIKPK